jgi:DNA (cytosine-5)-methyltransferase 1
MKKKVLILFAGLSGESQKWENVDITAVEINKSVAAILQDKNPTYKVINGNAKDYLEKHYKEFEFIWGSPPCPTHSKIRLMGTKNNSYEAIMPDMELYSYIIFLKHYFKGKWVIENVNSYYKPLIKPTVLLDRHYFWSNFSIPEKRFEGFAKGVIKKGHHKELQKLKGISIEGYEVKGRRKDSILRSYVNPKIGEYIFNCAFKTKQMTIGEEFQKENKKTED